MGIRSLSLSLLLLSSLLLAGCLQPTPEQLRMQKDLEIMKRHLRQLEIQQADTLTAGSSEGETVQRQVAEALAGLDNLRVEIRSTNGRLDDLGHNREQEGGELQLLKDDLGLQLGSLEARLGELEKRLQELEQAAPPPVQQPAATAPEETPEQLYQRALDLVRKEERFAEGRQLLEKFTSDFPRHDLYVNALYWVGEALYGEKKYEPAILQFQDVISKYKSHSKAPAAMFKQALAFNALGDEQNARTTMQKLIEEYPTADQVAAAKKFLNK
jgi:tol-pal system protein YbgF